MLHIQVIAVGKLKERFWAEACGEYLKRLGPYANVAVHEVADVDPAAAGGVAQTLEREGAGILKLIDPHAFAILLDIGGKQLSSEQLSQKLDTLALEGRSDLAFVIGGSHGAGPAVRDRADLRLSFGPITLPHNLARVVLLEQLYRSFKIMRNEPYHK